MSARGVAGWTALVSGLLLLAAVAGSALAGPRLPTGGAAYWRGPGMMGPGMMGGGRMGPGMMGFGNAGPAATAIPGAAEVRVSAANFRFTPSELHLAKGVDLNLTLVNTADVAHDLTVPALGIHLVAGAGETRTIGLRALPSGRYDAYCSLPGHADLGMRAIVIVE